MKIKDRAKVRKDFDLSKEYSVNVEGCTEDEKKEVQQAFFDAGMPWEFYGRAYVFLWAVQYSNTMDDGEVTAYCMYGNTTEECNMTAEQFLNLVYEDDMEENKGHIHAELMAQYAKDAKTSKTPWVLWEYLDRDDGWTTHRGAPGWYETSEYRRKPKTHVVNGVEIPDLRVTPELGDKYYLADPASRTFFTRQNFVEHRMEKLWVERGLTYEDTEEGKQAAILHAKAMLGMDRSNV